MRRLAILLLILPFLALTIGQDLDLDPDPDSDNFEKYHNPEEREAHIIHHSVNRLVIRPENEKYPFVVTLNTTNSDELDRTNNEIIFKYITPKTNPKDVNPEHGEHGLLVHQVEFRTTYIDTSKDIIIVPFGKRGLGYPVPGAYIVFRKSHPPTPENELGRALKKHEKLASAAEDNPPPKEEGHDHDAEGEEHNKHGKHKKKHHKHKKAKDAEEEKAEHRRKRDAEAPPPEAAEQKADALPPYNETEFKNMTKFYMNIALISRVLNTYSVEWSILDSSIFGRNRLEQDLCRARPCDILHYMIGVCELVSHSCPTRLSGPTAVLEKYTWSTNPDGAEGSKTWKEKHGGKKGSSSSELAKADKTKRESDNQHNEHLPNSMDLLILKRDDTAFFENSLVGRRSAKNVIEDCNGCELTGAFYVDFEEDLEYSKLLGGTAKELKDQIEKTTKVELENEGSLKNHSSVPFIGYGYCNLSDLTEHKLSKTKEVEDIGKFLATSLRLTCDRNSEDKVRTLFTSKYKLLEIHDDYSVDLARTSPILKYKILTTDEFRSLMLGEFLKKYIKVYREEVIRAEIHQPFDPYTGPMEHKVSKPSRFFTKLILNIMESFTKILGQHYVRGHRFILRALRDKFNTDLVKVLTSSEGQEQKNLWTYDLYRLMALKEFILYGLGPNLKSGTNLAPAFHSFEIENEKRNKRLVQAYGVAPVVDVETVNAATEEPKRAES